MIFSNYHSHTTFCDGKDSPEEMVLEAIRLGCPELGFSGHGHVPFEDCCMSLQGTEEYRREVLRLKESYGDRIRIYLGVEQDFFSDLPAAGYDYVIGSVHYLLRDGQPFSVDLSRESQIELVSRHYGGDYYAMIEEYYETVGRVHERTGCQIVGHFDLVTKFNEAGDLFDTAHPRYRKAALQALDRLCGRGLIFEINTGAMARGYRRSPYPEDFILQELRRRGEKLLFSSDCHDKRYLLHGFAQLQQQVPEALEKLFG